MSEVRFTPAQLDAVNVDLRHMDACVVAGPGSGKTTVLVEYFKRLVEAGVDPLRILAITFTEKAAANMRKKLGQAFQGKPDTRARLERAWVSTVHGFCARLLKENAVFAGVDPEFRVLDATESWRMQQEAMRNAIDSLFADHLEGMRGLIRGLSSFEFEQAVLSSYDTMRGAAEAHSTKHRIDFAISVVLQRRPAMASSTDAAQGANLVGLSRDHRLLQLMQQLLAVSQ